MMEGGGGSSANIGALEVGVVVDLGAALDQVTELEEKLATLAKGVTVPVTVTRKGGRLPAGGAGGGVSEGPSAASMAAAGGANIQVTAKLEEQLSTQIRAAVEAAFREPLNIRINVTNLEEIREQLGAVQMNGSAGRPAVAVAAGTAPEDHSALPSSPWRRQEFMANIQEPRLLTGMTAILKSGEERNKAFASGISELVRISRSQPESIPGGPVGRYEGTNAKAMEAIEVLNRVLPGLAHETAQSLGKTQVGGRTIFDTGDLEKVGRYIAAGIDLNDFDIGSAVEAVVQNLPIADARKDRPGFNEFYGGGGAPATQPEAPRPQPEAPHTAAPAREVPPSGPHPVPVDPMSFEAKATDYLGRIEKMAGDIAVKNAELRGKTTIPGETSARVMSIGDVAAYTERLALERGPNYRPGTGAVPEQDAARRRNEAARSRARRGITTSMEDSSGDVLLSMPYASARRGMGIGGRRGARPTEVPLFSAGPNGFVTSAGVPAPNPTSISYIEPTPEQQLETRKAAAAQTAETITPPIFERLQGAGKGNRAGTGRIAYGGLDLTHLAELVQSGMFNVVGEAVGSNGKGTGSLVFPSTPEEVRSMLAKNRGRYGYLGEQRYKRLGPSEAVRLIADEMARQQAPEALQSGWMDALFGRSGVMSAMVATGSNPRVGGLEGGQNLITRGDLTRAIEEDSRRSYGGGSAEAARAANIAHQESLAHERDVARGNASGDQDAALARLGMQPGMSDSEAVLAGARQVQKEIADSLRYASGAQAAAPILSGLSGGPGEPGLIERYLSQGENALPGRQFFGQERAKALAQTSELPRGERKAAQSLIHSFINEARDIVLGHTAPTTAVRRGAPSDRRETYQELDLRARDQLGVRPEDQISGSHILPSGEDVARVRARRRGVGGGTTSLDLERQMLGGELETPFLKKVRERIEAATTAFQGASPAKSNISLRRLRRLQSLYERKTGPTSERLREINRTTEASRSVLGDFMAKGGGYKEGIPLEENEAALRSFVVGNSLVPPGADRSSFEQDLMERLHSQIAIRKVRSAARRGPLTGAQTLAAAAANLPLAAQNSGAELPPGGFVAAAGGGSGNGAVPPTANAGEPGSPMGKGPIDVNVIGKFPLPVRVEGVSRTGGGGGGAGRAGGSGTAPTTGNPAIDEVLGISSGSGSRPLRRFDIQPSDRAAGLSASLQTQLGRIQTRSIATSFISSFENLFGGRQGPLTRAKQAQAAITSFNALDVERQQRLAAAGIAEEKLKGAKTPEQTKKFEDALAKANKAVEDITPKWEAAGKVAETLTDSVVGASDMLRNFAAGAVGGVVGITAAQGVAAVAQTVIKGVSAAIGPAIERGLGSPATQARITLSQAQAFQQSGGNVGAIAAQSAATGISAEGYAALQPALNQRATTTAGNLALRQQVDLIRSAAAITQQNQGLGGYDLGLFQTTNGFMGTPIGGTPSTAEILKNELENLAPFNANGTPEAPHTVAGKGFSFSSGPNTAALQESQSALKQFNDDATKGGTALQLVAGAGKDAQKQIDALAAEANKAGRSDLAAFIESRRLTLKGGTGNSADDLARYLSALNRGSQTPSPQLVLEGLTRQFQATMQVENAQLTQQLTNIIPAQFGLQQAANPIGNLGAPLAALGVNPSGVNSLVGAVNQQAAAGQATAQAFVGTNLPEQASAFADAMGKAAAYGKEISQVQIGAETAQAAYQAQQWSYQLYLAKRSLSDAEGLTGKITADAKGNLGVLERQNFLLNVQAQNLGFALSQRQINYQVAIAGFTAPGITGEERAARIQEAKIEADYAQKQLDLQKQIAGVQRQSFQVSASRSLIDAMKQFGLAVQGIDTAKQVANAQATVKALSALQDVQMQKATAIFNTAQQRANDIINLEGTLAAQTGASIASVGDAVMKEFATAYAFMINTMSGNVPDYTGGPIYQPGVHAHASGLLGMTTGPTSLGVAGEAGGEAVAIIRNPKPLSGSPFGSAAPTIIINVTGNTIGSNDQVDYLVSQIEKKLGRRASLFGLRLPS